MSNTSSLPLLFSSHYTTARIISYPLNAVGLSMSRHAHTLLCLSHSMKNWLHSLYLLSRRGFRGFGGDESGGSLEGERSTCVCERVRVCVCVCMYACMRIYMYLCMYVYVYVQVCMFRAYRLQRTVSWLGTWRVEEKVEDVANDKWLRWRRLRVVEAIR